MRTDRPRKAACFAFSFLILLGLLSSPLYAQGLKPSPKNKNAWVVQEVLARISSFTPKVSLAGNVLAAELVQWGQEPLSPAPIKRMLEKGQKDAEAGRLALSLALAQLVVASQAPADLPLQNSALTDGALNALILRLDDFPLIDSFVRSFKPLAAKYPWTWGLLRYKSDTRRAWKDLGPIAGVFSGDRRQIRETIRTVARRNASDAAAMATDVLDFVRIVSSGALRAEDDGAVDLFGDDFGFGLLFLPLSAEERKKQLELLSPLWKAQFPESLKVAKLITECGLAGADERGGYSKARFDFLSAIDGSAAFDSMMTNFRSYSADQQNEILAIGLWLMENKDKTIPSMRSLAVTLLGMKIENSLPAKLAADSFFVEYGEAFSGPDDALVAYLWDIRERISMPQTTSPTPKAVAAWNKALTGFLSSLASGFSPEALGALAISSDSAGVPQLFTVMDAALRYRRDAILPLFNDPKILIRIARSAGRPDLGEIIGGAGWASAFGSDRELAFFYDAFAADVSLLPIAERLFKSGRSIWTFRFADSGYLGELEATCFSANLETYADSRPFAEKIVAQAFPLPSVASGLPLVLFGSADAPQRLDEWKQNLRPRLQANENALAQLEHVSAIVSWWEASGRGRGVVLADAVKAAKGVSALVQSINQSGALPISQAVAWAEAYGAMLSADPRAALQVNALALLVANLDPKRDAVFAAWKNALPPDCAELRCVDELRSLSIPSPLMKDAAFARAFDMVLGARGGLLAISGIPWADNILGNFKADVAQWRMLLIIAQVDRVVRTAYLAEDWKYTHDAFPVKLLTKIKDTIDGDPTLSDSLRTGPNAAYIADIKASLSRIDSEWNGFFQESDDSRLAPKILRNRLFR